ncbi:hypothetical protein C8T65DRAFT_749440 [Cerioporus squamosus]|nr:hypothetical protein C8T65DRAFT_749440 [Cerioporus squamosus]
MSSAPSNATDPTASQLPPNLTLLAGPQLLGAFLMWGLQGVLTLQHVLHVVPAGSPFPQLLVWGTFIWEWVQVGLITQNYFDIYVYDYGSIQSLTAYHNSWFSAPIMTAVVSFVVQCFFAWRIWMLSSSKVLTGVIVFLSFAQMALGIAGGVVLIVFQPNAVEASLNRVVVSVGLITATVVDAIIAGSMTYLLLSSRTGIKQTDAMIHKLVRLVVETGVLTAAVALVYAILFMTRTNDLLFECPSLVLPKVYSNTFLVSLNNRAFASRPEVLTHSFTTIGGSSMPAGSRGIRIDVSQEAYPAHDTSKDVIDLVPMGREEHSGSV